MFTGLVEAIGIIQFLKKKNISAEMSIHVPSFVAEPKVGDSISVNGCCLTVASIQDDLLHFDLLNETLQRTNLGMLEPGFLVNLERSLAANARLGGHFVQGHIDCTASVLTAKQCDQDLKLTFELPHEFSRYLVFKGAIAINGVSLTVAEVSDTRFSVWIIPHTRTVTNLGNLAPGNHVNLEFDILAKYTERILGFRNAECGTRNDLHQKKIVKFL